jgi:hypothetical protein|tara:strand:+ start:177 stop:467 length:291 start_codon:yes stop_codon:yes gene_type:complete
MKHDRNPFRDWRKFNPHLNPLWDALEAKPLKVKNGYYPSPPIPQVIEDIGCCLNWQQGIPLPIAIKRREAKAKKAENIKIFKEMMDEDIRPHHFNK